MKRENRVGFMAITALAMVSTLAIGANLNGYEFEPSELTLMLPTDHFVNTGTTQFEIDFDKINICKSIRNQADKDSIYNISGIIYDGMIEACDKKFDSEWMPTFNRWSR